MKNGELSSWMLSLLSPPSISKRSCRILNRRGLNIFEGCNDKAVGSSDGVDSKLDFPLILNIIVCWAGLGACQALLSARIFAHD